VAIGGRAMKPGAGHVLTPQTRQQVRAWLERPVLSQEVIELRGHVRAIDLDLRRSISAASTAEVFPICAASISPPKNGSTPPSSSAARSRVIRASRACCKSARRKKQRRLNPNDARVKNAVILSEGEPVHVS